MLFRSAGAGSLSKLSVRGGRCGGVLPGVDFVLGPRRRGDAGSGVDARSWSLYRSAAPAVWLVVVWMLATSVRGSWSAAGGSGAVPRRLRWGGLDLEVDVELGARPRPTSHSDKMGTSGAPLLRFLKPRAGDGAASSSGMLVTASPCLGACRGGAVDGWRVGSGGVGCPCSRVLPAVCTGVRVLPDIFVRCVRLMYSVFL